MEFYDIKTDIKIDESFDVLYILIVVVVFIVTAFLYRVFRAKKRKNQKLEYANILKSLDLTKTKESAYTITFYGRYFRDDEYDRLIKKLEPYKYKKEVEPFSNDVLEEIESFVTRLA